MRMLTSPIVRHRLESDETAAGFTLSLGNPSERIKHKLLISYDIFIMKFLK